MGEISHVGDRAPRSELVDRRPLADRLADPIEEATTGVTAMLSQIIRKTIKSGVQKLDEGLSETVAERITEDLEIRGPELERQARDAARAEAVDQLEKLTQRARETAELLKTRLGALEEQCVKLDSDRMSFREEVDQSLESLRAESREAGIRLTQALEVAHMETRSQFEAAQADLLQRLTTAETGWRDKLDEGLESLTGQARDLSNDFERATTELRAADTKLEAWQQSAQQQMEMQRSQLLDVTKALQGAIKQLQTLSDQIVDVDRRLAATQTQSQARAEEQAARIAQLEERVFRPTTFEKIKSFFGGKKSEANE